ncbi:hypothetical protein POM88_037175 [Heracleum sosnowskyi]|uniref:TF-B3 domain-containing protein n=1 Tax=Heracleum sosnowskyi TaxID=360622 RepID=A0AAD8HRF1_9APIA|nr:hypothetical protein POM88_037175 [Heracleum sosnowskyi]
MACVSKFMKLLTPEECVSNEMVLPDEFVDKYAHRIPIGIKIKVRNGYELWLDFVKTYKRFFGLSIFYKDFKLRSGQRLLFEYMGGFNFNVVIFGICGSEIEYPLVVHESQEREAREVLYPYDGWSFVNDHFPGRNPVDKVVPPFYFIDNIAAMIPNRVEYVLSDGQRIVGSYCHSECELTGLASLCHILGVPNLKSLNLLVFSYEGGGTFKIAVFDKSMLEIHVHVNVHQNVSNSPAFRILVQQSHMLEYCHGVGISKDFRNVTDLWLTQDSFTAYSDNRCWRLEIKKRRDWARTEIHGGWIQFRDDMQLGIGDVCVFQFKNDTLHNFNVRVIKKIRIAS